MYKEINYANREEWHEIRNRHIGGSDVSVIMGCNKYNDDIQKLWRIKTGREKQEDLSENSAIKRGTLSESLLLEHFKINNPSYTVSTYDKTLESIKFSFMSANLDGVLENERGEKGILEIKTANCPTYKVYENNWKEDIPIEYYLQIQHYLIVTGWSYAILYADIKLGFAENKHEIRQYFIPRDEDDIKEIIKKEIWFNSFIINDVEPPYTKRLEI